MHASGASCVNRIIGFGNQGPREEKITMNIRNTQPIVRLNPHVTMKITSPIGFEIWIANWMAPRIEYTDGSPAQLEITVLIFKPQYKIGVSYGYLWQRSFYSRLKFFYSTQHHLKYGLFKFKAKLSTYTINVPIRTELLWRRWWIA